MLIDCTTCRMRGTACGTCVVSLLDRTDRPGPLPVLVGSPPVRAGSSSVLVGSPPALVGSPPAPADGFDGLTAEERRAMGILIRAGLVDARPARVADREMPTIRHSA